jgi:glycosyltransferase involved in cell wall biosynthesis
VPLIALPRRQSIGYRERFETAMKLSIVIPVYNEVQTIRELVDRVVIVDLDVEKEIVLVDDFSTDGSRDVLKQLAEQHPEWRICFHEVNRGKGAALRTGFAAATGDVVVIQDADLEYDPHDIKSLLGPIRDGHADVVYGSRFLGGGGPHRVVYYWHYLGNRFLTTLSNMMTDLNLTDMEVCYKMFRREVLTSISLQEERFGFEVEVTAKVARGKWRIYEVPIAYYGRNYAEGKKITWKDGVRALWCILKYRFT